MLSEIKQNHSVCDKTELFSEHIVPLIEVFYCLILQPTYYTVKKAWKQHEANWRRAGSLPATGGERRRTPVLCARLDWFDGESSRATPRWWVSAWGRTEFWRGFHKYLLQGGRDYLQKLYINTGSASKAPHRSGAREHPSLGSTGVVAS
jgi:hypothetical protein